MSSGGGNTGNTQYNWNPFMENMWGGDGKGNPGLLNRGVDTLNTGYTPYEGQRIADFTKDQTAGFDRIRNVALNGTEGANAAETQVRDTLQGKYLNSNPYSSTTTPVGSVLDYAWQMQPDLGKVDAMGQNANLGKVAAGTNQYAGMDNPYFNSVLQKGAKDITDQYQQGTQAQTQKMMNLAGIFGGGAHQKAEEINQKALGDTLANYNSSMGNTQYDRSANLTESGLGMDLGAQQFNVGTQQQDYSDAAARAMQAGQFNIGQSAADYQSAAERAMRARTSDVGNQMQGSQFDKSLGSQNWNTERGNMVGMVPQGWAGEQRALGTGNALLGIGGQQQQQDQLSLDNQYQDWTTGQNWERNNVDWMANLLGRAQGGIGSSSTTSAPGYQFNPYAGLLGGAALYGAMRTPS